MSRSSWKDINTRCITRTYQIVSSNNNTTCNGSDGFQESQTAVIPNFSLVMYAGPIAGFLYSSSSAYFNQPCDDTFLVPKDDWYVVDASFIANYISDGPGAGWSDPPQLVNMLGCIPMGVVGYESSTSEGLVGKKLGVEAYEGMPQFGNIDISSGIVPSHTHDLTISSTDDSAQFYSINRSDDNYSISNAQHLTAATTTAVDISLSDISGINLNNVCSSTPLSQNSTTTTLDNLDAGEISTNGYKATGIFYIIYFPAYDS